MNTNCAYNNVVKNNIVFIIKRIFKIKKLNEFCRMN